MSKFKKGDRVRVVSVEGTDIGVGISVGDTATVLEDNETVPYLRMDKYNENLLNTFGLCEIGHGKVMSEKELELITEIQHKTMHSTSKYAVGDVVTDEYGTTGKIQAIQHRYQIQGSQYAWIDEDEIINKVEALEQDAIQLLKSRGYVIKKIYDNE
jgi:signal peptidase I